MTTIHQIAETVGAVVLDDVGVRGSGSLSMVMSRGGKVGESLELCIDEGIVMDGWCLACVAALGQQ